MPLLARLYSATEHDAGATTDEALYLVRLADQLTYRQFVALAVFAHHAEYSERLIEARVGRQERTSEQDAAQLMELDDLGTDAYLASSGPVGR